MQTALGSLSAAFKLPDLRRRILYVFGIPFLRKEEGASRIRVLKPQPETVTTIKLVVAMVVLLKKES